MRLRRLLGIALLAGLCSATAVILARRPGTDRPWAEDHARMPRIVFDGPRVRIAEVRNFRYQSETDVRPAYEERIYDSRQVSSAWLVLAPFSTAWRGAAHSFVSFGFDDSSFVAVSIEARREAGEEYGLLRGLVRSYELIYVIGDERDLIGKRALGPFDLYLYPIAASREKVREMFLAMLRRAEALRTRPEFYHTAWNNCTSNLVAHANLVSPGAIPGGLELLAPGYADRVAHRLGLLATDAPADQLRRHFRIDRIARDWRDSADFSRQIRRELPAAFPVR